MRPRRPRGFLEGLGRTGSVLARVKAGIKATRPAPLFDVDWHAGALADGADANVVKVDVPGLPVGIVTAAAGEGGHDADKSASRGRRVPDIVAVEVLDPLRPANVDNCLRSGPEKNDNPQLSKVRGYPLLRTIGRKIL
jgi:hypothetical protein